MLETASLWILDAISNLVWNGRGVIITFIGMIAALYISELMIVGKKARSIKATLIISFVYTLAAEIVAFLLSPSPFLVVIVQIVVLATLINHFYEDDWLVIFAVALVISFVIIIGLALLSIVFEAPRPY